MPYSFVAKSEDFERDDRFILEQIGIQEQIGAIEARKLLLVIFFIKFHVLIVD